MMSKTINIVKTSEIRKAGIEVLIRALGSVGLAEYFGEYDDGG